MHTAPRRPEPQRLEVLRASSGARYPRPPRTMSTTQTSTEISALVLHDQRVELVKPEGAPTALRSGEHEISFSECSACRLNRGRTVQHADLRQGGSPSQFRNVLR